jgi:hypothetical protein
MLKESLHFTCFLIGPLLLGGAGLPDFHSPGGGSIHLDASVKDRVKVTTDYWRLEFDLRSGGALDTIVFPHGPGKNLLKKPFRAHVDELSDWNAVETALESSQEGDVVRLVFSGTMAAIGRVPGPVGFESVWTLSPVVVRADCTLKFAEHMTASSVGVASTALRSDLNEFSVLSGLIEGADRFGGVSERTGRVETSGTRLISEQHIPLRLLFFRRGVEGLDFNPASDLATWESGLAGRSGLGEFSASLAEAGKAIRIRQEPLRAAAPVRIRKGNYTFSYYLGLPRIVEKTNRKWRHLSFGNHPWPSDEEIRRWAENGVNLVRLHNDYSDDGVFWRDGAWPPYDDRGMAEVRRVVATCHRHKIQVVPYFSVYEFHPEAQGFAENVERWKRSADPAGTVLHNRVRNGEYGAQMCPVSGWLDKRKRDVERTYRELGVDGIYYDWVESLPCNNKAHAGGPHTGMDGVIDLLAWTRRLIGPGGVLFLHSGIGVTPIAFENFGDVLITMEDLARKQEMLRLQDIPITGFLGEDAPRVPCPSYRTDLNMERNQNNIAVWVALGIFPMWRATGPSTATTGGPGYDLTLKLFRTFQPYKLENYRLYHALSGAVRTGWEDVYGAVYASPEKALVVLSNANGGRRRNVPWRVDPAAFGFEVLRKINVKDVTSGKTQELDARSLSEKS